MKAWLGRLRGEATGQALIEAALTLPLLLILSVSVFEFGRAFQYWQILTNAAREGARIATLPGTSDTAVSSRVYTYLDGGAVTSPDTAVVGVVRDTPIDIGGTTAPGSTVTVSYPFNFMVLEPLMLLVVPDSTVGAPITMTVSATMRNE
jgi:Flp pilus assembly protein TadG